MSYDDRFETLPSRNVSLSNCLQSYKYFREVEDQLRLDLTFAREILDTARQWLDARTPQKWRNVGICLCLSQGARDGVVELPVLQLITPPLLT